MPTLTQDFTDDRELLAKGVTSLKPFGGSAVFDAIQFAVNKELKNRDEGKSVRRLIILISDGEDNQSRMNRDEILELARRAEVTIYAISTNTSNTITRGDKLMARLAEETGGRALFPLNIGDVAHAFETIRRNFAASTRCPTVPLTSCWTGVIAVFRSLPHATKRSWSGRARATLHQPTES